MSEPTGSPPSEPSISEEEVRKYLEQLRSAPAEQILSELLSVLLNAAQAKLGRNDARLLIDLSALLVGHARPHLSGELVTQVDQALGQLRMAQVQAENRAESAGGAAEPNDLPQRPNPPAEPPASPGPSQASAPAPSAAPPSAPPRPGGSGLWVPGRDF